jgi:hypothetical protein
MKTQQTSFNYTMDVLKAMIDGMIANREFKGFRKLHNGLFEDCTGQVFTVVVDQFNEPSEDKTGVISHVQIKLQKVAIVGRF